MRWIVSRPRAVRVGIGLLTFVAAHLVLVARWTTWFHGQFEPWFLNSGSAVAFTLGSVGVSSFLVALCSASANRVWGITFAAGASVGMTLVLFLHPGGAGSIFPIVMAVGGGFILLSSVLGAFVGAETRRVLRGRL